MPEAGYLYVMINPAMPGLVKIGKTTRNPEERVLELSSATGVPTPFILVYSASAADCDIGEERAHILLEAKRVAANREFFACSPTEAINAVLNACSMVVGADVALKVEGTPPPNAERNDPAEVIFQQALAEYEGRAKFGTDAAAAFKGFRQAAKLGHPTALRYVAECYEFGRGVKGDGQKAYASYKAAAVAGDDLSLWPMVRMHCRPLRWKDWDNSQMDTRLTAITLFNQHLDRVPDGYRVLFEETDLVTTLLNPRSKNQQIDTEKFLPAATMLAARLLDVTDRDGHLGQWLAAMSDYSAANALSAFFLRHDRIDWARQAFLTYLKLDNAARQHPGYGIPYLDSLHPHDWRTDGKEPGFVDERLLLFGVKRGAAAATAEQRTELAELLVDRYRQGSGLSHLQEPLLRVIRSKKLFDYSERAEMEEAMRQPK